MPAVLIDPFRSRVCHNSFPEGFQQIFTTVCFDLMSNQTWLPPATDHAGDAAVLVELYSGLSAPDGWLLVTDWLVDGTSFCNWYGISCDCSSPPCRVREINFSWNALSPMGQRLPDSIGNLEALENLILAQNFISSTLPASIGNLTKLKRLDLSMNSFVGAFPESILRCTLLRQLDLSGNRFSSVPNSLATLRHLEILAMDWMPMLPGPISFQNFTCPPNIRLLGTSSMHYSSYQSTSDFQWICGCSQLTDLRVSGLTGPFPEYLGRCLPQLKTLIVRFNQLSGSLPSTICWLTQVDELRLQLSSIQGPLPDCFMNFTKMKILDLQYNSFESTIPPSFGSMPKLRWLSLTHNQFVGSLPSSIQNATLLDYLDVSNNFFNGTLDVIATLPKLLTLNMMNNLLTGSVPANFSSIGLADVALNDNRLSGTLPVDIFQPTSKLFRFEISNNQLSGKLPLTVPEEFKIFSVDNNRFHGSLPGWICSIGYFMETINLAGNFLNGEIPPCIGNQSLGYIQMLNMSFNQLSGTIPDSLGKMNGNTLRSIDFRGNSLTGTIPPSFTNLKAMSFLDLSMNQFSGTFPSVLTSIGSLSRVDISQNAFSGSLDHLFNSAIFLPAYLNISRNKFSGQVSTLTGPCNYSNTPACLNIAILDARGNQFDCPMPTYNQHESLFLRDACLPPYGTFFIYCGSLFAALLVLFAVRYFLLRQFGNTSVAAPSYAPSTWKWATFIGLYIFGLFTLASDAFTMYSIGQYLLSRIDNCELVNFASVWKSMSSIANSMVLTMPQYFADSFPQMIYNYIYDLNINNYGPPTHTLSQFDSSNLVQMGLQVSEISDVCLAIQSGCAMRHSSAFESTYASECYMAFDDQAPFGGTSHRLFAYICIAIVAVRALVELGKASVVVWSWVQGRIVGARWSIDFVGASLLSPLFVLSLGGDWSEYFKVVVSHEASYWSLAWRVVHQSLLCSVPLLCANLYFLFAVSQSGLQLLNMFSVLSACVSIPLTIVRAVLAWRSLDQSYSTSDVARVLEFSQNVVDIGRIELN